ncbi:hypothetical protein F4X86_00575 [Candidatus Saccharibacteria bacterium]|nr:hypothetical protein [Candidatus Saccharibacteria bacterium]
MLERARRPEQSRHRLEIDLITWADIIARIEVVLSRCGRVVETGGSRRREAAIDKTHPAFPLDCRSFKARIRLGDNPREPGRGEYEVRYSLDDGGDAYRSLFLGFGGGPPCPPVFAYAVWLDGLARPTAARPASQKEAEAVRQDLTAALDDMGAVIELPGFVPGCDGGILRVRGGQQAR